MKNASLFIAICLVSVYFLSSCKKDDNEPVKVYKRLTDVYRVFGDNADSVLEAEYFYEGDKLQKWIKYMGGSPYLTGTLEYDNSSAILHWMPSTDSTSTYDRVYTFNGEKVISFIGYSDANDPGTEYLSRYYTYEGGRMISCTKYGYKNDSYVVVEKLTLKYSDGKLSNCSYMMMPNFLDSLLPFRDFEYKYNNGKISEILCKSNVNYEGVMVLTTKREFEYSGDNVKSIKTFIQNGDSLLLSLEETFSYDADGYLIMSASSNEVYKFNYYYEPGRGNGSLFNDPLNFAYGIVDLIH